MKSKLLFILILVVSAVLYIATLRGIPGNAPGYLIKNNLDQASKPFELSPERGRYILVLSLANNHRFSLSKELAEAAFPDVGYIDGRFYVYFAPGISLLALPFYLIGSLFNLGQVATFAAISIFALLNIVVLYRICRDMFKLSIGPSFLAPLIFAFGSIALSYSNTLYQHHVTAFFITSSLYAVWRYRKEEKFSWLWALYVWVCYGLAIGIDYPNGVLMLPVMIYLAFSTFPLKQTEKKLTISIRLSGIITAIAFVLITALHGYYNYVNFGSPTKLSGSIIGYKQFLETKEKGTRKGEQLLKKLQSEKNVSGFFQEENIPFSPYTLLISADRGIFLYAPIYILAVLGIFSVLRKLNSEINAILGTIGVHFFLYSSWGDPWGGWAFGPRYMIPSLAVLSIFIGIWLQKYGKHLWAKLLTLILFTYSSAIAFMGAVTTNAVPPKVEADFLKMKYNFLHNYDFLMSGKSSSFIFNEYFSQIMSLQQYYTILFVTAVVMCYILLFIVPMLYKDET